MDYKNTYVKKIILAVFLLTFLVIPFFVFAQEINYPRLPGSQAPQDFLTTAAQEDIPGLWIKYIINLCTWAAGLIAFLMMVVGGIEFLISAGNPVKIIDARKRISNSFLGLLIILSAYFVLAILSSYFVNFSLPDIESLGQATNLPSAPPEPGNSSVEVSIPLGRIIENIFQTYNSNPAEAEMREVNGEERPFAPETLTRIQRINNILDATLPLLPPIQERTDRLQDLSDDCDCLEHTTPDPPCNSSGCVTLFCTSDPCETVRGEMVNTERELLPYLFEISEDSLPEGSGGTGAPSNSISSIVDSIGGANGFEDITNSIQGMGGLGQLKEILDKGGGLTPVKSLMNFVADAGGIDNFTQIINGVDELGGMEEFTKIIDSAGDIDSVKKATDTIIKIGGLEEIESIIKKAGSADNLEDIVGIVKTAGGTGEIRKVIDGIDKIGGTDEIIGIINKVGSIDDLQNVIKIVQETGGTDEAGRILGNIGSLGGLGNIDDVIRKAGSIDNLEGIIGVVKAADETNLARIIFGHQIELQTIEKLSRILGDVGALGGTNEVEKIINKVESIDDLENLAVFIRENGGIDSFIDKIRKGEIEENPEFTKVMDSINKLGGLEEVRRIINVAGGVNDMEGIVKIIKAAEGIKELDKILGDVGSLGGIGELGNIINRAGSIGDLGDVIRVIKSAGGIEGSGRIFGDLGSVGGLEKINDLINKAGSVNDLGDIFEIVRIAGGTDGIEKVLGNIGSIGGIENIDNVIKKAGSIDDLGDAVGVIKDIGGIDYLKDITGTIGGFSQFGSVVDWVQSVGGNDQAISITENINSLGGIASLQDMINNAGGIAQINNMLDGIEKAGGINSFENLTNQINNAGGIGNLNSGPKIQGIDGITQHDAYGRVFTITTNLTKELEKTEEEIKDLKYWFDKLGRAEELIRDCDWTTLTNRSGYLQKKDYFAQNNWMIDDAGFWDDATASYNKPIFPRSRRERWYPSPGTPLETGIDGSILYCTVGGTSAYEPIYFETNPYFLEKQLKIDNFENTEEFMNEVSDELACDVNIPYGEVLDKAHRLTRLLINKLELIADREKKILEATENLQQSISRCSSRLCVPICIPLPHGGCLQLGCMGIACPWDINDLAQTVRDSVRDIQEAVNGIPTEKKDFFMGYYLDAGIKYIFNNMAMDLLEGMEQTLRRRMPLCSLENPTGVNEVFLPCKKALYGTDQIGRVITQCLEGTVKTGDWQDTRFGGCLNNCFLTQMSQTPTGNHTNTFESSSYKKCINECMASICVYNYDHMLNFFCCYNK